MRRLLPLLALAAVLSACADSPRTDDGAGSDGGGVTDPAAGGGISRAENDLVVEYDAGDGSPLESWSLTCVGSVSGTHSDAEEACAHVAGLLATGATSGRALALGLCTAIDLVDRTTRPR